MDEDPDLTLAGAAFRQQALRLAGSLAKAAEQLEFDEKTVRSWAKGSSRPSRKSVLTIDNWLRRRLGESYRPGALPSLWYPDWEAQVPERQPQPSPEEQGGRTSEEELAAEAASREGSDVAVQLNSPADQPSRGLRWVLGASLLVVLTAATALVTLRGGGSQSPQTQAGLPCADEVGRLDTGVQNEADAEQWRQRLRSVFDRAGGEATAGCPTGAAYRWHRLVVQEMSRDGVPSGSLVVSPNNVDVYLNRAAWGSYHQLGGREGDAAQIRGGLIDRIVEHTDGHVEIELSTGSVLVAERRDAPYFWIPAAYVPWWRNHPELGLPTGNPLPPGSQDFQHGIATVDPGITGPPVARIVEHPEQELPTLDAIRGRILRQPDSTAWFVDVEGRRLWIPDGATWSCLGGEQRRLSRDLPGYAIATLPLAGQARCPA